MKNKIIPIFAFILAIVLSFQGCAHNINGTRGFLVDFYNGATINTTSAKTGEVPFEKYGINFIANYESDGIRIGPYSKISYTVDGDYSAEEIEEVFDRIFKRYERSIEKYNSTIDEVRGYSILEDVLYKEITYALNGVEIKISFDYNTDNPNIEYKTYSMEENQNFY